MDSTTATARASASYKALKEDFVSNLNGGGLMEINQVTAVAPIAVALWGALQTRQGFFAPPYTALAAAVDFLLNVGAILLATTLYARQPLLLDCLLLAPIPLLYALPRLSTRAAPTRSRAAAKASANAKARAARGSATAMATTTTPADSRDAGDALPKKPFLTAYRGTMLVITCLAILAVDFRIFPRRFAKVETWGTSLMDVGVGSFVFSAGLVAARPVLKQEALAAAEASSTTRVTTLGSRLWRSTRHSLPLLVLGFIRLWSVKGLDYAEHVSEYGVHWNFFFTLGFMPPFVALFDHARRWIPSYAALAILLSLAYQIALEYTGLKAYVLSAPRTDLLAKNREGIFSFIGYLSIFLAGQSTGMYTLPRQISPRANTGVKQRTDLLKRLGQWAAVWILLFLLSTSYRYGLDLTVSRRLANLPYVLWICAFNTTQILAFCLVETLFCPQWHRNVDGRAAEDEAYTASTSRVLRAYNRNGLAVFLLANLATGLVNVTCKTLHWGDAEAMALLMGYAAVVTSSAMILDTKGWNLRL